MLKKSSVCLALAILSLVSITVLTAPGCGKKPKPQPVHYQTASGIRDILGKDGINPDVAICMDRNYALPSEQWLAGDFSNSFMKMLKTMKSNSWLEERNDCDNFAEGARWFAQILHNNTMEQPCALAFGVICYKRDIDGVGHAINLVLVFDEVYKLVYYEPQNGSRLLLSPKEKASAWFILM